MNDIDAIRAHQSMCFGRTDSPARSGARLSTLAVIYLVAIFFLASRPDFSISVADAFDKSADAIENMVATGDPIRQAIFISFGLLGFLGCTFKARARIRPSGWVSGFAMALALWSVVSIGWSGDPGLTLRRLSVLAMMVVGTAWIARRYSIDELPRVVLLSTATYLVIGIVTELMLGTLTPLSPVYRFSGAMHPNQQGENCAMLLLSIVALAEGERHWSVLRIAGAGGAFVFLLLTKSRTSLLAAVAALVIFWYLKSRKTRHIIMVVLLFGVCASFTLSTFASPSGNLKSLILMGREPTDAGALTGRTFIWDDLQPYFMDRPIEGYGYSTFWTPARVESMADELGNGVTEGHSTYFDLLLDLGFVGLILYCGCLAFGFARSISRLRAKPTSGSMLLVILFAFFAIHDLAESSVLYPALPQFIFLWCLFAVGWRRSPNILQFSR